MNEQIRAALQQRIETFANDLTSILQKAVADAIADALRAARPSLKPGKKAAPKATRRAKGASKKTAKKSAAKRNKKAGRAKARTKGPAVTAAAVLAELRRNPGQGIEELARSLGTSSDSVSQPLRALVEEKAVKKKGLARGTKYRPADAKSSGPDGGEPIPA